MAVRRNDYGTTGRKTQQAARVDRSRAILRNNLDKKASPQKRGDRLRTKK